MKYLLLLVLPFLCGSFAHPFYLGVTELHYNPGARSIEASVKLFTNDLENAISRTNGRRADLINYRDTAATGLLLNNYLQQHLNIKINGSTHRFRFIGFEREEEATWMYIEFDRCDLPRKIELDNSLLYDQITKQTNIVRAEVNGEKKSAKCSYPDRLFRFDF